MSDINMRKIQLFLAACLAFPAVMIWINERIDAYKERRRDQQRQRKRSG